MNETGSLRDACWQWLNAHKGLFDLTRLIPGQGSYQVKACGELMIVLAACINRGLEPSEAFSLRAIARGSIDAYDWQARVIQDVRFVTPMLVNIWFLQSIGEQPHDFIEIVTEQVALGRTESANLAPHRKLELRWLLAACGIEPLTDDAFASLLSACYSLWMLPHEMTLQDWYAVAHIVFYLTDYGAVEARTRLTVAQVANLRERLRLLITMAIGTNEVDVIAELLLSLLFVDALDHRLRRTALASANALLFGKDGCLASDDPTVQQPVERCYHPALLWAYATESLEHCGRV